MNANNNVNNSQRIKNSDDENNTNNINSSDKK